jgi:hypothetical protein
MGLGCAGEAQGRLEAVDRLEAGTLPEGSSDPVILLVRHASGDEEVGAAGANLKGVILCHSLPHLSHLGECNLGILQLLHQYPKMPAHALLRLPESMVLVICMRAWSGMQCYDALCADAGICCTGVRARQEKVPFATCEDKDTLKQEVESMLGESAHMCLSCMSEAR